MTSEDVFGLYREEITCADAVIAATPLDGLAWRRDLRRSGLGLAPAGETVNLRRVVLHVIEETARHAGHLGTARKLLRPHRPWLVEPVGGGRCRSPEDEARRIWTVTGASVAARVAAPICFAHQLPLFRRLGRSKRVQHWPSHRAV